MNSDVTIRHLLDLCRRNGKTGLWHFSAFLSPAEQDDFIRCPEAAGFACQFFGGYEAAERKILAAGSETESGPPEWPLCCVAILPKSDRFAEPLTHRDYLGAILGLGIDRSLIGDILVRDGRAWVLCLSAASDLLVSSLTQVRRTAVVAEQTTPDIPELQPRYADLRINVASERLDAVIAAFAPAFGTVFISVFDTVSVPAFDTLFVPVFETSIVSAGIISGVKAIVPNKTAAPSTVMHMHFKAFSFIYNKTCLSNVMIPVHPAIFNLPVKPHQ